MPVEIPSNKRLTKIEIRSIRWLINEVIAEFRSTHHRSAWKTMIHWFSTDAKQELLNDHCRKFGKEALVNVLAEMMFLEDDQVMEMLASFCMPVSPAEYCEMMIKHIKQVGLWEVDKIVPLKDYRDKVQAKVERALTEMTWFDDFFRSNASS